MIGYQLAIRAARDPRGVALVFGSERYSYARLNERACRLANGLAAIGIGRGDRVAALLHNCPQFIEALFAAAKIGAIFVPINFRLVAREVALQLAACTPHLLLVSDAFAEMLPTLESQPSFPQHTLWLDDTVHGRPPARTSRRYEAWLDAQPAHEPESAVAPEEALMLAHSSGTTGLPKGVVFTHATTHASCAAKIIDFELADSDVAVVFGPLFHAGPLFDLTLPVLLRGGRVVLGRSRHFDPARLLRTLAEEHGTVVPIYPTMLRRVVAEPPVDGLDLSALRLIISGGEPVPVPLIRAVHARFPGTDFVNNYGSTEGGPITTFLAARDGLRKIGSVGKESFSVEVRIADGEGRTLCAGEIGDVLVRSPFVCRGYWNRPEETAASCRDGWWRTGDLAWRDDEGFIWIAGRSKDLIKSGAESIYPIEVEQVIATLEGVEEVSVIGVPDEEWGETVAAFVVRKPGAEVHSRRVIEHCRLHLASYKKPHHVIFVDELPRGATNKVSKNALQRQWAERGAAQASARAEPSR